MNIRRSMMIAVVSAATGLIGLPHVVSGQQTVAGGQQTTASGTRNASGGNSTANSGRTNSSGASSGNTSGNSSNANAPAQNGANNNNTNNNAGGVTPIGSGKPTAGSTLGTGSARPIDPSGAEKAKSARARNRARNDSRLMNAETTSGFAAPVIVPYYGAVPYNGFGFGYNYGGWGDYYGNDNVGEANGGSANPPAASPATATQNPEADAARNQMVSEQSRLLKEYMNGPEYKQAVADVRKATDDFNAAVAKVRGAAAQAPDVKDAHAKEDQAQRQVEAQQAAHHITPGATQPGAAPAAASGGEFPADLTAAAQRKLDAKTQAKRGEGDRLMQDPDVKQSKQRLDEAVAHLQQLQGQFEQQVTGDKEWVSAKQKLDSAMAGGTPSNRKD